MEEKYGRSLYTKAPTSFLAPIVNERQLWHHGSLEITWRKLILIPLWPSQSFWRPTFYFHIRMVIRISTSESLCTQLPCVCRGSPNINIMGMRWTSGVSNGLGSLCCVVADVLRLLLLPLFFLLQVDPNANCLCLCKFGGNKDNGQVKGQHDRSAHVPPTAVTIHEVFHVTVAWRI